MDGTTLLRGHGPHVDAEAEQQRPELEQRLASIGAEIARGEQALERYYEAFERGKLSPERFEERLTRLHARLEDLRAHGPNSRSKRHATRARSRRPRHLAEQLEQVIAEADPQKAKALLRLLIEGLRVNGRREILPTYPVVTPAVCAM